MSTTAGLYPAFSEKEKKKKKTRIRKRRRKRKGVHGTKWKVKKKMIIIIIIIIIWKQFEKIDTCVAIWMPFLFSILVRIDRAFSFSCFSFPTTDVRWQEKPTFFKKKRKCKLPNSTMTHLSLLGNLARGRVARLFWGEICEGVSKNRIWRKSVCFTFISHTSFSSKLPADAVAVLLTTSAFLSWKWCLKNEM